MGLKRNIKETPREKRVRRKKRPYIIIVCEGKDTEPIYFENFKTRYININIIMPDKNLKGKNKGKVTDPVNLVRKAKYYKENEYEIRKEDGDMVWCILDTDINYKNPNASKAKQKELEEAYKIANTNNINLAISNPCFEIWYLLHFEYTTAFLENYDKVKQKLLKIDCIKDYEKNKDIYVKLKDKTQNAINNAKKLKSHYISLGKLLTNTEKDNRKINIKDLLDSNPYTNVCDLVEYIDKLSNDTKE